MPSRHASSKNTRVPTAIYMQIPDEDLALLIAALPETHRNGIIASGILFMLDWPDDKDAAMRLASRCTDHLPPPEQIRTDGFFPLSADERWMQQMLDGEFQIDIAAIRRRLPDSTVIKVMIYDGSNAYFTYTPQTPEVSRLMGTAMAASLTGALPVRH